MQEPSHACTSDGQNAVDLTQSGIMQYLHLELCQKLGATAGDSFKRRTKPTPRLFSDKPYGVVCEVAVNHMQSLRNFPL